MQKISTREHRSMMDAFRKFDALTRSLKHKINPDEDLMTREGIKELQMLYFRFFDLLSELDDCAKNYEKEKKKIQSILNKNIRKMNSELKKKNINI